jgi:uncharacterized cupin superfamily protein
MERVNLFTVETESDPADPQGYIAPQAKLGPALGATMLGGSVYDLAPDQSICPYHCEFGNEEWLVVLEGRPTLRHAEGHGEARVELDTGDVVCFPKGRAGAHKVSNHTDRHARVLMLSTMVEPDISYYPDSDKYGVWTGEERDSLLVRRESGVDYYEGEI